MNPVSSNRGKYKSNFSKTEKSNELMAAIEQWPEAKANNVLMKDHAKRFNIPPSTLSKKSQPSTWEKSLYLLDVNQS